MPVAAPSGYDPNNLIPFIGFAIRLGAGARSIVGAKSICILANKIQADIVRSVDATSYTTKAGTLAAATPTFVSGVSDSELFAGAGSEADLAAKAIFRYYPNASVYMSLVDENGSAVKATGRITYAGTATSSGVARLKVNGRIMSEISITNGMTAATLTPLVAGQINQISDWPVTATYASTTVAMSAKQGGTRGNNIVFEAESTAAGITVSLNGGTASAKATARFGAGTATAGTGADDLTNALASIATQKFFIVSGADDTANWNRITTHLTTYAGIQNGRRQQAVVALNNATVAAAIAQAQAQNYNRLSIAYQRSTSAGSVVDPNVVSTAEIAANVAVARLFGDGILNGTVRGELAYPAVNLNNMQLGSVFAASEAYGSRLLDTEKQQLLVGGISPVVSSALNPGKSQLLRSVTAFSLDASNNPTNSVKLTSYVTVTDYVADGLVAAIASSFPSKNIGEDPGDGSAPSHPDVVFISQIRSVIASRLSDWQTEGLLVKTKINNENLQLEQSTTDPSTIYGEIPESVIRPFNAFAATLSEVGL